MISLTSYIGPKARIDRNVEIAPFVYIGDEVEIGDNCEIMPYASILPGTKLGRGNRIFAGSILGAAPMHREENGHGRLIIGNNNIFRENCVITTGSFGRATRIGNSNYFGADISVQSGTLVGNRTTIQAGCKIGERCEIANVVLIQHMTLVDPDISIGTLAEVQALCHVGKKVPPYITVGGPSADFCLLNTLRLRQSGVPEEAIVRLRMACLQIYHCGYTPHAAVERIEAKYGESEELHLLLKFLSDVRVAER